MRIPAPQSRKPLSRRLGHMASRWWRRILVVQDTPHRVAWGFALGIFIGWLPIMGIQMLVAAGIAWVVRANVVASLPGVWISNPLTFVPMYWFANRVGAVAMGGNGALSWKTMREISAQVSTMGPWDATVYVFEHFLTAMVAMTLGGTILGLLCALPCYFLVLRAVDAFQRLRHQRLHGWRERRRERLAAAAEPAAPDAVGPAQDPPGAAEEPPCEPPPSSS